MKIYVHIKKIKNRIKDFINFTRSLKKQFALMIFLMSLKAINQIDSICNSYQRKKKNNIIMLRFTKTNST